MITYQNGDCTKVKADLLVNPANGKGWMGGMIGRFFPLRGVAESIHYQDPSIEKLAKKEAKRLGVRNGDIFHTPSGSLGYKNGILHVVTMNRPGKLSDLVTIDIALDNIINYCNEKEIKTASIPLIGTGTGKVNKNDVLNLYQKKLNDANTLFIVAYL